MNFLIFSGCLLLINSTLKSLQPDLINQVELPDIQNGEFGFGGYFQYSPIIYQVQRTDQITYHRMLLGSLIQKETQISQLIIYAQLNSENQVIDHVLILDEVKKLQYSVQPLLYEGKWFLFYFQYHYQLNQVEILISDTALSQKKIYKFDNSFQIHQVKYIIQFAGYFNNPIDNVYYSFYKGLYYQIVNTTANFDIISESSILSNTGSAKCQCQYLSTLSNTDFYINKTQYYKESISQGCYDYSIQTWVKIVDYNAKLPIEIISVSHNQNVDYYNHVGGIAFRMYYQFINELLNINIVTYSYTFPSIEVEIQPDPNLISYQFQNVQVNILNWHFFKFEKLVALSTFTLTFPTEDIQISKVFGKLYQFSLPKLNYYLAGSLLSEQNITAKYFNLTIDHCYKSTIYKVVCHISCLTCNGPTLHDCLSCDSAYNRELVGNLCACKLGYLEQFLKGCSDLNKQYYNITSIPITEEFPTGFQQIKPYLICIYGYFQIENICVKCPSIQNENIITCIECLTQQYVWQYSLICKFDMVKQFEIFEKQPNLRNFYYIANNLVECVQCNIQANLFNPQAVEFIIGEDWSIQCEEGYYYSNLRCLQKQNYFESTIVLNCGQFCESCNDLGKCLYCLKGNYFISSDGMNCELCLIENCEYCYIFDLDDSFYETLSQLFSSRIRTLATLRVGCAKCAQGFYFDFTSLKCTLVSTNINNCEQQVQHNNKVFCLLSSLTDFSISVAIDNCNEQLKNCKQCYFSPIIFQIKCNICEIGYYVNRITGHCETCGTDNCFLFDSDRKDKWLSYLEPFYSLKYSGNSLYSVTQLNSNNKIMSCEHWGCDICDQDINCQSCPLSKFGQIQQTQDNDGYCQVCNYLCSVCVAITFSEYEYDHPKFVNEMNSTNESKLIYLCLKAIEPGYIDAENTAILCDKKPCKLKKSLSCNDLQILGASMSSQAFEQDFEYLEVMAIKILNFQYDLNFNGDCQIINLWLISTIKQYIYHIRQTTIKFRGMFHQKGQITQINYYDEKEDTRIYISQSFTLLNYQIVSIEDITFSISDQQKENIFEISNQLKLIDVYFANLIIVDQLTSGVSFSFNFNNVKNLTIANFTLINITSTFVTFFNTALSTYEDVEICLIIQNMSIINSSFYNGCFLNLTDLNTPNLTLQIENLYIYGSQFSNYSFLQLEGIPFIGTFESFRNINFNNVSFVNSIFFNLDFNESEQQINSLQIQNSSIYENSIIILSGNLNLNNINISNNLFYNSQFMSLNNELYTNNIFNNLNIQNNIIQSDQPLINIKSLYSQCTFSKLRVFNNTQNQEFVSPIIYNSVYFLKLIDAEVFNGLINQMIMFQLQNIYQIQIYNISIQQINNKHLNILTSTQECFQYMESQNVIRILDSNLILISNLSVSKFILNSNPIVQIVSNFILFQNTQEIILEYMRFQEILLVKTSTDSLITIISITNQNPINIDLRNCKFKQIWMHQYQPDDAATSSAILSINSVYAIVNIISNEFEKIMITNSTNSIMNLNVRTLQIQNSIIFQINSRNATFYNQFLFWDIHYESFTSISELEAIFRINSDGGFLNVFAQNIVINNITVSRCSAQNGGFAKITTKEAFVTSQQSIGGLLYIVSDNSLLSFYMENCRVEYATARQSGGSIFITPSTINNIIMIRQSSFTYCSSDEGAILTAKFLDSIFSRITLDTVEISNILIEEYIKSLNYISKAETMNIQVKNYAIVVYQSSYFHLKNCNFYNQDFTGFLSIENTPEILIYNVTFQNFTFAIDSSIYIGYTKIYEINILIDKIIVRDGKPKTFQFDTDAVCKQKSQENKIWYCNKVQTSPKVLFDQEDRKSIKNCIIQQLVNILKIRKFSPLINIDCNKNYFKIKISRLQIHNIYMSDNNYGLFQLILNQIEENICKFSEIILTSNTCGLNGCFLLIQTDLIGKIDQLTGILNILDTNNTQNTRILQSNSKNYITMNNCQFYNNSAFKGAGIVIVNLNTIIQNSSFISNVVQTSGSFIYYYQTDSEFILSNIDAFDNFATYGQIFKIGHYLPITTTSINIYSQQYQIDQVEYPVSLTLLFNKIRLSTYSLTTQNQQEDQIILQPYFLFAGQTLFTDALWLPSGQSIIDYSYFDFNSQTYIPLNLSGAIIPLNSKNEQISYLSNSQCTLYYRTITYGQLESQEYQYLDKVGFNDSTQNYDLNYQQFNFDPYQQSNNYQQIKVQCDCIQDSNYFLSFKIKTFECQLGEYYYFGQCLVCNPDQSYYSLDPKYGKCEIQNTENTIAIKSAMVQLKQSFWRYKVKSNIISYCINNPTNCEGGWEVGQNSCKVGYIGALCEECDIYDIRGGKYSKTQDYNCIVCSEFLEIYIKAVSIAIWTFISVFLTCDSVIQSNKQLKQLQLTNIHFKILHKLDQSIQLSILIKMTTNFIQIISIVISFHLKLNIDLNFGLDMLGNPVKQISTLIDCSIINQISYDLVYYRVIVNFILTILLINGSFVFYAIILMQKKVVYTNSVIWIILIYVFLLTQPGHIYELSSILAYRTIANENWVKAQVNLLYDTSNNYFYILVIVLPFLFLMIILIPLYLTKELYKNRKRTFDTQFRKKFSYLINEYKEGIWYWEIVKQFQRVLAIISLNYYSDYIYIKSSLVYIIIIIYLIFLLKFQPYNSNILTHLEVQSVIIQISVIILAAACYYAQIEGNSIQFFYLVLILSLIVFQLIIFLFKICGDIQKMLQKRLEELFINYNPPKLPIINSIKVYIEKNLSKQKLQRIRICSLKSKIMPEVLKISQIKSQMLESKQQDVLPEEYQIQKLEIIQNPQNRDISFTNRQDEQIEKRLEL